MLEDPRDPTDTSAEDLRVARRFALELVAGTPSVMDWGVGVVPCVLDPPMDNREPCGGRSEAKVNAEGSSMAKEMAFV